MCTKALPTRLLAAIVATLTFWSPGVVQARREAPQPRAESEIGRWSEPSEARESHAPGPVELIEPAQEPLAEDDVRSAVRRTQWAEGTHVPPAALAAGSGKSAVTPQAISLPKGEGSIEGMGESFSADLSSGTGSFGVPVLVPKGRNGVQPSLTLSYVTSAGNGPLGFGWSLGVPFISRQSDKGLPRYVNRAQWHGEEDTFMYNGGQELVPVDGRAAQQVDGAPVPAEFSGWQQYRARVEGSFMRFFRAPDSKRWVVQGKDGMRFDFGLVPGVNGEPGVQADPEDPARIYAWQLVRMSDVHGSAVHYRYLTDRGARYLEGIYYTSPARCASPDAPRVARECSAPLSDYAHRVRFVYEPRRDVTSSYFSTWRIEQALRLKRIEVTSAESSAGTRYLVRRYHLGYDAASYHSLLTRVQMEGRRSRRDAALGVWVGDAQVTERDLTDRIVGDTLPAMEFSYTSAPQGGAQIAGFGGIDTKMRRAAVSPDHSVDEARVDLFDVNADGLADVLVTDPARFQQGVGVYFNGFPRDQPSQAGSFSPAVRVAVPQGMEGVLNLSNANVVPMDIDGDGRGDLLHMPRAANYGYFVLGKTPTAAGAAHAPLEGWSFHHVSNLLPRGQLDPRIDLAKDAEHIRTLDVNNDHLIDLVRTTGTSIQTWLNLGAYPGGAGRFGSATWTGQAWSLSTTPLESCLLAAGGPVDFADSRVQLADMNGDGLQDIARVSPHEVIWWPGRGTGVWGTGSRACQPGPRAGREIRMGAPRGLNAELSGVQLMDVNEDGATDLVQVAPGTLSIWFSQGGQSFTDRLVVSDRSISASAIGRVRVADMDGSSTADLVFAEAGNYRWLDLMGGRKPRLLTRIQNGLGAETTLEYGSSAEDYLRDLRDASQCDPLDLSCFTWQREPVRAGEHAGACDAKVLAHNGTCVHRSHGSPVVSTVVRRIRTADRLNVLGAQETTSQTEYRYHDGYYEGIEQEFRGFGAADAIALGDEHEPTSITRTHFHQGRRPNDIAADRLTDNPNESLKGREFLSETFDEKGVYLSTSHATYAVRKLLTGLNGLSVTFAYVKSNDTYRYDTSAPASVAQRQEALASVTRERSGSGLLGVSVAPGEAGDAPHTLTLHGNYVRIQQATDEVDNLGHVRKQTAWGRAGRGEFGESVADERIVEHQVPMRVDDRTCGDTGWLWRTSESYRSDGGDVRYGHSVQTYTACGDARLSVRHALVPAAFDFSAKAPAVSYTQRNSQEAASTRHDAWGQPLTQCGGADLLATGEQGCLRLGKLSYDEAYGQLVIRESTVTDRTGGAPHLAVSQATWDRGLGLLRSNRDPSGALSEVIYDGLGRLTASVQPSVHGCEGRRVPSVRIDYDLTPDPAGRPLSRMTTTTLLSCTNPGDPDQQQVTHAYVDGMGKMRASLAEGDSDGAAFQDGLAHAWVASGKTSLTKKGKPFRAYQASFYDGAPTDYRAVLALPATPFTQVSYDAFGRVRVETNEDGSFRTRSYHALSSDICDEVDNGFGAEGDRSFVGTCTTQRSDGHQRTIDQHLRQRTADGRTENHRLFTYYRADGSVLRVVRALTGANVLRPESGYGGLDRYVERAFYYDTLGRRIASEDPDTDDRKQAALARRTWRYLFNTVGDLAAVRDPRGCGQNYYYDLAGRLVGEVYVGCAEAQTGELASANVPVGSVGLGLTTASVSVHVRHFFDAYPSWALSLVPDGAASVLGRAAGVQDRAQRSVVAYDARGNVVWSAKQVALIASEPALTTATGADGRPAFRGEGEVATASASRYDEVHTYERTARFDHAGRSLEMELPFVADVAGGEAPRIGGRLRYHRSGTVRGADLLVDGAAHPVIDLISYARDGLPVRTRYGDGAFTGRDATESTVIYDARRRPVEFATRRTPSAASTPGSLSAVSVLAGQRLSWDGASNLYQLDDLRLPQEWPAGHKPYSQRVHHDALYRVAQVEYTYATPAKVDDMRDFRAEEARHRSYDPMRRDSAPMLPSPADGRVMSLSYSHDWLANMTEWDDDAHNFYERSLGNITSGNQLSSGTKPAYRPGALYLATNLDASTPADLGGWLEADYGAGGNLLAMTVHARCTHRAPQRCADVGGANLSQRATSLRNRCACASEQHYVYRWDELNRMHDARRYDRKDQGAWQVAARQRYRYDHTNQRTVKQAFDLELGTRRSTLYVYPGDFERRGLDMAADEGAWVSLPGDETQYMVAGARVVWQSRSEPLSSLDAHHRITLPLTNLIQSTSAVLDLVSGEPLEAGGFYPNGAREELWSASEEIGGARVPLEPQGFTGKEADDEVGLTYFGERYLVPRIGRWASPDPLSIHASDGGEVGNSYHYISGNLLQGRDPLGLREFGSYGEYTSFAAEQGFEAVAASDMGSQGHWLTSDRVNDTGVWQQANETNLQSGHGFAEYTQVEQRADFYRWYDQAISDRGHEVRWAGSAARISDLAGATVRAPRAARILADWGWDGGATPEMSQAALLGNEIIFTDVFGKLRDLYNQHSPLTGQAARDWDARVLAEEQTLIQTMYDRMSPTSVDLWERAARQPPVARLGLAFTSAICNAPAFPATSDIRLPADRWQFGMTAMGYTVSSSDFAAVPVPEDYQSGARFQLLERAAARHPPTGLGLQFAASRIPFVIICRD